MTPIDELVIKVRDLFGKSRPNGLLLAWDRDRFYSAISRLCKDCKVGNCTDFNYSCCNSFEIQRSIHVRDDVDVLTFKVSFLADVFSIHVTRYAKDQRHGKVISEHECADLLPTIETIRRFADQNGFQELDGPAQEVIVEDLSLELSDPATLGKCLFDDFE